MEKVYYIRYRKQGKLIEEKVGGQYRDNMTAAKDDRIRFNLHIAPALGTKSISKISMG